MTDDCVFCGIVDGEIPNHTVYEDDDVLAFLDVNPVVEGHVLVIPKEHHERVTDMDAETTAAVFDTAREVATAVESGLEPDGFNLFQTNGAAAGQEVFHAHVHVLPRWSDDDVEFSFPRHELGDDEAERVLSALHEEL